MSSKKRKKTAKKKSCDFDFVFLKCASERRHDKMGRDQKNVLMRQNLFFDDDQIVLGRGKQGEKRKTCWMG